MSSPSPKQRESTSLTTQILHRQGQRSRSFIQDVMTPARRVRLTPVKASQPSARSRALAYASTITPPRPALAPSRIPDRSQKSCIGWQYLDEQARFKLRLAGLYVGDDDSESAAI